MIIELPECAGLVRFQTTLGVRTQLVWFQTLERAITIEPYLLTSCISNKRVYGLFEIEVTILHRGSVRVFGGVVRIRTWLVIGGWH